MKRFLFITGLLGIFVLLFFITGEFQFGDKIIIGKHFDTPLKAYEHSEDIYVDDIYDIETVEITDEDIVWITNIDGYIKTVQMHKKNGEYISTGNEYSYVSKEVLYDITCDSYKLNDGRELCCMVTSSDYYNLNRKKFGSNYECVEFTCSAYGQKGEFIFLYKKDCN